MFELDVVREFSAAHSLRGYNGDCSALHGHNWMVQVFIQSPELDAIGIAVDFKVLKKELNRILEQFDHKYLNDLPCFADINPTSENLARVIYKQLSDAINGLGPAKVAKVRVCESPASGASYYED